MHRQAAFRSPLLIPQCATLLTVAIEGASRDTDAQKAERTAAIQSALRYASEVPLKVAKAAAETAQLAQVALGKSNPNVASDARVAHLLAEAARDGAVANVEINLGSITDEAFAERMREELEGLH